MRTGVDAGNATSIATEVGDDAESGWGKRVHGVRVRQKSVASIDEFTGPVCGAGLPDITPMYTWGYIVEIENAGPVPVRIIGRHWSIKAPNSSIVTQATVGGKRPLILPGETFSYFSGLCLGTLGDTMRGSCDVELTPDKKFKVEFEPLVLPAPAPGRTLLDFDLVPFSANECALIRSAVSQLYVANAGASARCIRLNSLGLTERSRQYLANYILFAKRHIVNTASVDLSRIPLPAKERLQQVHFRDSFIFRNDVNQGVPDIVIASKGLLSGDVFKYYTLNMNVSFEEALLDLVGERRLAIAKVAERYGKTAFEVTAAVREAEAKEWRLPDAAPELYADRGDKAETAVDFLRRVWGRYLDAGILFQVDLKRLDMKLYEGLRGYAQRNKVPSRDVLPPPGSARTDFALAGAAQGSAEHTLARIRIQRRDSVARHRARRTKMHM